MEDLTESIAQHVAGATVRHASPFAALQVPNVRTDLTRDMVQKWVMPHYMTSLSAYEHQPANALLVDVGAATEALVAELLANFNWRPRTVGARLAMLNDMTTFEHQIGRLLLRSDVCYAGQGYCVALASFASDAAVEFLEQYLDYYLSQPQLWFDQNAAVGALAWTDGVRGTNRIERHRRAWDTFVANKPNWGSLDEYAAGFAQSMRVAHRLRKVVAESRPA